MEYVSRSEYYQAEDYAYQRGNQRLSPSALRLSLENFFHLPYVFLDVSITSCKRGRYGQGIYLTDQVCHESIVTRYRNLVFLHESAYILFCLHNVSRYSFKCLRPRERCDLMVPEGIPVIFSISFMDFSSM